MKKKKKKTEEKEKKDSKVLLKILPILFNALVLVICILALKYDDINTVNYLYLTPVVLIVLSLLVL